jgi:hypothetical protein
VIRSVATTFGKERNTQNPLQFIHIKNETVIILNTYLFIYCGLPYNADSK